MLIAPTLQQGGLQRVCVKTAHLLAPYYDVTVVVFNGTAMAYDVTGLSILDLGMGVKKGRLAKLINIARRSARLRRLKRSLQPTVAYSFGATANLANAFSKTKGTKVWLGLRSYMDMGERVKMRLFVRQADLMVCCSKNIEAELRNDYRCPKVTTVYNPYDVESILKEAAGGEPELPWPEEPVILVSMGREDDVKGFWHLLKVFALVRQKIAAARLLIMGEGTFAEYRQLAADLGVAGDVYFAGMQKEPYCYLKKGSVYLLTSLNEGFPNALVEGMVLGLAAVSVDCLTGPAEILAGGEAGTLNNRNNHGEKAVIWGSYGILVPLMDGVKDLTADRITPEEKTMAAAVIRLLSDEGLLDKYRQASFGRAKDFSHEEYVRRLTALIG